MESGTSVEGIGHLLSDRLLAIPDYQRAYSWDSEEVAELWYDVDAAMEAKIPEYFLGIGDPGRSLRRFNARVRARTRARPYG